MIWQIPNIPFFTPGPPLQERQSQSVRKQKERLIDNGRRYWLTRKGQADGSAIAQVRSRLPNGTLEQLPDPAVRLPA